MTKKTSATNAPGNTGKQRLPQLQRASKDTLPSFRLTERDIEIIQAVYAYRALTTDHIETLLFSPSTHSRCLFRLKNLYHHGFLLRTEQPQSLTEGRKPFVYWLD
jgi:predicted transcriptional regulator